MKSIRARAPRASSPAVRRVMQAVRSCDTLVEALLRSRLHRLGLRFRKHTNVDPEVRCKADVVFRAARLCVFVDGCFWHGCPAHYRKPRANSAWWDEKVAENRRRDRRQAIALRKRGWAVVRIWEHAIAAENIDRIAYAIAAALSRRWAGRSQRLLTYPRTASPRLGASPPTASGSPGPARRG